MIQISAGNLAAAEPVLAIRWCLEPADFAKLREAKAENIHILFVIAYQNPDGSASDLEDRFLFPLDPNLGYLQFRRPGSHTVFARLLWGKSEKELRNEYLSRFSPRAYNRGLLSTDHGACYYHGIGDTEFNADVSKDYYPKEHSERVKRLVNWWFPYPAVDQCQFRRRAPLVPLKLLLGGIWAVMTTVIRAFIALVLGLCGLRNVNFGAVIHPWRNDILDVGDRIYFRDSWFWYGKDGEPRPFVIQVLFPPPYLMLAAGTYLFWPQVVKLAALIAAHRLLVFAVIFVVLAAVAVLFMRHLRHTSESYQEMERRRKDAQFRELMEAVVCSTRPLVPDISAVPSARRTFRLRYQHLKAKVCAPYAA